MRKSSKIQLNKNKWFKIVKMHHKKKIWKSINELNNDNMISYDLIMYLFLFLLYIYIFYYYFCNSFIDILWLIYDEFNEN